MHPFSEKRDISRSGPAAVALLWHSCCTTSGMHNSSVLLCLGCACLKIEIKKNRELWPYVIPHVVFMFFCWNQSLFVPQIGTCHFECNLLKLLPIFFTLYIWKLWKKNIQEIVSIYPALSPPTLSPGASNRVCNALALLQVHFDRKKKWIITEKISCYVDAIP